MTFRAAIEKAIPEGFRRDRALQRIDATLDPEQDFPGEAAIQAKWQSWQAGSGSKVDAAKARAGELMRAGCTAPGAPYVVKALTARMSQPIFFGDTVLNSPLRATIAAAFLKDDCAGAKGLTDDDRAQLKRWAAPSEPGKP